MLRGIRADLSILTRAGLYGCQCIYTLFRVARQTYVNLMDAMLILGAAVWLDGPSPTLRRRTAHAAMLWHQGAAPLIIPCGGIGQHPPSEAAAMADLLLADGVPEHAIRLEDQSTTTLENIRNARALFDGRDVLIITDRYHARRAAMVARHFHLRPQLSCPDLPHIALQQHLREALARPAYALRLRRTPRI